MDDESLLEDSVFSDGAESSDFVMEKKPKAMPKKAAVASKAKKPATTKSKAAASKKRAKLDSDIENSDEDEATVGNDSLLSNTPPKKAKKAPAVKKFSGKPLAEIANESFGMAEDGELVELGKAPAEASDKYKKISHLEHILIRPDTYIGSVERTDQEMWVYNSESDQMEFRKVNYVPGLYKIFDEILVNAADNKQNDKTMSEIKVTVDREKGEISVQNDGKGIPIEIHKQQGIYIPEMIFGHLLSSSNYDDNQAKVTGGRNGYGAKLCNVFSTEFSLETVDSKRKKKYKQTWNDNMSKKSKAKITDFSGKDYTKVTFHPDYEKFGMEGMDDDFEALVKRRIYDMAGTCDGVRVSLNGTRIKIKNFQDYMRMYTKAIQAEQGPDAEDDKGPVIVVDTPNERWTVGFAVSDGSFKQVSFVNSIATTLGGTHVKSVSDQIIEKLLAQLKKDNKKGVQLKPAQISNHIFLFLNCKIVNPAFTSQTKEQLTTKQGQFGSKCPLSDAFFKKILKTHVMKNIMDFAARKADQLMAKSDGSKRARMNNSKLTDANKAGTKDGWKCTLILTEGDSASGLALAGRAVLDPDHIGVFPLRGKLLNVRDASIKQITENQEIQNIKKFMGLQHKKEYTDTRGLRYGHLMIMTDQDHDGSHIKGLLINFLETQFPSLLKIEKFLQVFITPIVKCWKGDAKHPTKSKVFYTMPEYEDWRKQPGNGTWEHKYYKGLGTSSTEEAESYFRDLDRHLKEFEAMQPDEAQMIDLAFSKKKADARKNWLRDFVPGTFLDMGPPTLSYDSFVNKELILFSMADNMRSIPSVIDGLKPSQRKVMYTCFRINLKKDRKVVELSGTVSGMTAYPYGETSLQQTIVGLAQTFVGSNNINLLEPSGNFGSRRLGGQDSASPRYIYTRLSPFARRIFHAADAPLLNYHLDDGKAIEPFNYVPIVPLVLLNGADGIGTGWSTSIPNFNPVDIVDNLKRRMSGTCKEDMLPMQPWFRGFKGEVQDLGANKYSFSGIAEKTGSNEVEITELPIRYWTQDFKDKLEDIIKAEKVPSFIKDYAEYNTPTTVHFVIKMDDKHMESTMSKGLEETFKLTKTMSTTNLVAFDAEGRIHKYETALDIMEEFYHVRLKFYEKRKQHLLDEMNKDLERSTNQARFIKMIIDGKLSVSKKKKAVLVEELRSLKFKPFPKKEDAAKAGEKELTVEDEDEAADNEEQMAGGAADFDYLLGMAIWSLTQERVEKLMKQIGDKELEIDTLIKLSPKDLWTTDLDDFVNEWHTQLEDEKTRAKKSRSAGRRGSSKLGLAGKPAKRKRKGEDDSDDEFMTKKPKKPAAKPKEAAPKAKAPAVKQKSVLESYFQKSTQSPPTPKAAPKANDDFMDIDDFDAVDGAKEEKEVDTKLKIWEPKSKPKKRARLSAEKPTTIATKPPAKAAAKKEQLSEIDDMFESAAQETKPVRQRRAAAAKKYALSDSDSEESTGDDMLGDVSMMVKGIGSNENTSSGSRPLFSNTTARPSSSHGLAPRSISKVKSMMDLADDSDGIDETDYKSLIPAGSPIRPAVRRAGDAMEVDDDDDDLLNDSFDMPPPKPKAAAKKTNGTAAKPLAKTKAAKAKAAPIVVPKKVVQLSPAAKAYAAKQAKTTAGATKKTAKKIVEPDSDDEELLADDILDDDSDDIPVAKARPARAGRQAAKNKYVFDEDEDEEESAEEEDTFMVDDDSD
ncbi:type II DNA topoisomerase [Microthyrium microscopicum]|uniref:DNA topoisomerase 2 n=1 Tax=Microthyrium microscopicum TaxID=703497 RepID=A0A6A6UUT4_9PEZI|nr:type II DNA topoisomerase [Microthyrium microscopicum]